MSNVSPLRLLPVLAAFSVACSTDVPDEYKAFGIPPSPERVSKIDKITQGSGRVQYKITYETPFDQAAYGKAHSAILKAGYVEKATGMYQGPKGGFDFTCTVASPAYCFLTITPE